MKLLFCMKCHDVLKLQFDSRKCQCGKSSGYYKEDGLNAVLCGEAVPIGFANPSFAFAIKNQPEEGDGKDFMAFVIPESCDTVSYR